MARADVVVAGLGVMGAATALALAERGVDVVALDALAPPHDLGSSHGRARITRLAVGEGDPYVPTVARSHECWRALEAEDGGPRSLFIDCGLLVLGDARGAVHHGQADFAAATRSVARRHGIDHELLDAATATERYPAIVAPEGVAYLEPQSGFLLAEPCVRALQAAAQRRGAALRTGEAVLGWEEDGARLAVVTTTSRIEADRLVLCVGPWLPALVPDLARLLDVQRQVTHWLDVESAWVDALSSIPAYLWFHGDEPDDWFYGFPAMDGVAGGVKVATETYGAGTAPETVDRHVAPDAAAAVHRRHVRGRLHGVGARAVRSEVCLYTVAPDAGFVIDTLPGDPRVVVVSACSGHGFKHAPAVGECAAALALDAPPPLDCGAFSLSRFAR